MSGLSRHLSPWSNEALPAQVQSQALSDESGESEAFVITSSLELAALGFRPAWVAPRTNGNYGCSGLGGYCG